MLAVIEDQFKTPVGWQRSLGGCAQVGEVRRAIAVHHILDVAIRRPHGACSVALMHLAEIDTSRVFRFVGVSDDVAFVVVGLADKPSEDTAWVGGIGDAAFGRLAVPSGDVVLGDRAPERVGRGRKVDPMFDAGEQTLDTRTVAVYGVVIAVDFAVGYYVAGPLPTALHERRHQVFGAR